MRGKILLLLGLGALALGAPACGGDETTTAPPADVVELLDDWYAANGANDGSVTDLYVPDGYHMYRDKRYERDQIAAHLGTPGIEHEWTTEANMTADDGAGNYTVVRRMKNTGLPVGPVQADITFEIVTTPDGELRFAHTAWGALPEPSL